MTDTAQATQSQPAKQSKTPLILGLVLGLAGAGGGFYAVQTGMLFGGESGGRPAGNPALPDPGKAGEVVFVPVEPLVISLADKARTRHLRFRAQLEVNRAHEAEVTDLMPRVVDVLNGYLRALTLEDIEESAALVRLRSQMLRRVRIVTGHDRVRDLLIMEFVLN
jgi:flagellar FliL protein